MNRIHVLLRICVAILLPLIAVSCSHDDPEPQRATRRAILVYAVAYNDLSPYIADDMNEMIDGMAAAGTDADSCVLMVYNTDLIHAPALRMLKTEKDGTRSWEEVRKYDASVMSTTPERMAEVMSDFRKLTEGVDERVLMLWSHATGWSPSASATTGGKYWFGDDMSQGSGSPSRYMDITDLAAAIPRGMFSLIWADCCHMGGIEVAWQLRDHCDTYVAYPTEVMGAGMPYDRVLPYLMRKNMDIEGAAAEFFNYYDRQPGTMRSATVSVIRMAALPRLADACRALMNGRQAPPAADIQYYHRKVPGPYYDLREICRAYAAMYDAADECREMEMALTDAVVYAAATPSFMGLKIDTDKYCGLSSNLWTDNGTAENEFYKSFDWYKAVYEVN